MSAPILRPIKLDAKAFAPQESRQITRGPPRSSGKELARRWDLIDDLHAQTPAQAYKTVIIGKQPGKELGSRDQTDGIGFAPALITRQDWL